MVLLERHLQFALKEQKNQAGLKAVNLKYLHSIHRHQVQYLLKFYFAFLLQEFRQKLIHHQFSSYILLYPT